MLTIILAIAIVILLIYLTAKDINATEIVALSGTLILLFSIAVGIFIPVSGYKDWKLKDETKLVSLSNATASGSKGFIYVSLSADNVYTYRYEIKSEFGNKTSKVYKTETLVDKDVEEVEDSSCKVPVLKRYERKGKKSIWTFGLLGDEKYVFYVPEDSISKDVKLN